MSVATKTTHRLALKLGVRWKCRQVQKILCSLQDGEKRALFRAIKSVLQQSPSELNIYWHHEKTDCDEWLVLKAISRPALRVFFSIKSGCFIINDHEYEGLMILEYLDYNHHNYR